MFFNYLCGTKIEKTAVMTIAIVTLMLLGYLLICTEHITRINKATVALFCGGWGWV